MSFDFDPFGAISKAMGRRGETKGHYTIFQVTTGNGRMEMG